MEINNVELLQELVRNLQQFFWITWLILVIGFAITYNQIKKNKD